MCCYFPHFYALEIFLSIYNPGNPGHFPLVNIKYRSDALCAVLGFSLHHQFSLT